jgi:predicted Co/Zn/Cd cation transporter (cation efflux family)
MADRISGLCASIACAIMTEQQTLVFSIIVTIVVAIVGIICGIWINSSSIMFDGVYSLVDAAITVLALGVSILLARESTRRFQFGFWHLEPLLVMLNSIVLTLSCGYALLSALNDLFSVGRVVSFGTGAYYAIGAGIVALGLYAVMRRQARRLGSELIAQDARGWLVSGFLSMALCLSFIFAASLRGTNYNHLVPYIDPAVLALITVALMPLPLMACWRAGKEIIQVAPGDLDDEVRRIARDVASRYDFIDYTTYVAKTGRARFVDMTFLTGLELEPHPLRHFDMIRAEIAEGLGASPPSHWLNIAFTTDRRWL